MLPARPRRAWISNASQAGGRRQPIRPLARAESLDRIDPSPPRRTTAHQLPAGAHANRPLPSPPPHRTSTAAVQHARRQSGSVAAHTPAPSTPTDPDPRRRSLSPSPSRRRRRPATVSSSPSTAPPAPAPHAPWVVAVDKARPLKLCPCAHAACAPAPGT
ncbi:hypothetical protein PVAP13_3NG176838 [Panicum virgatum]|uniref:Uncharacterized protein n=1 Tax=Panicum virgatum TaxID=38727 RepID=A0A8T0U8X4_PANVG|nr:hypothetical protein PVAP13_3NG176838 [Panicum virgatum]